MPTATRSTKKTKIKQASDQVGTSALRLLFGDVVSSAFFNRNKFSVIIVLALFMVYIGIKYEVQTRMETIAKLEKELSIAKSESIRQQSEYKSRTRESQMQHSIDSLNLALHVQSQPPYILRYQPIGR
ncbi:MAG: hypothetical protein LIP09_04785 [Bacteroidales bacterium]|nr:hypothetical protein [Bacteroidales bacterium]